jgi:hypothetical protein
MPLRLKPPNGRGGFEPPTNGLKVEAPFSASNQISRLQRLPILKPT